MSLAATILISFVALEHLYILWFEMFAWTSKGPKIFSDLPNDLFPPTKSMAANQGLYNGFLATGLIWSLLIRNQYWSARVALFFLSCVVVAGIFGAFTISRKILLVQAAPAIVTIVVVLLSF